MSAVIMKALEKALAIRSAFFVRCSQNKTDAMRLFCGRREGIAGLVIDRFSSVAIMSVREGDCSLNENDFRLLSQTLLDHGLVTSVYLKRLVRDRSNNKFDESNNTRHICGEPSTEDLLTQEYGVSYLVRPCSGLSVGLFHDQRENRRFLASRSHGLRVLNLFSYTGAFSAACALQGAQVTSVDLSLKALKWGRKNFELNDLSHNDHRWICENALDFLVKAVRRNEVFDLIIVDPPSFSRDGKGKSFSVIRDLKRLFLLACSLANPNGGTIFVSTNLSSFSSETLKQRIELFLNEKGHYQWITLPCIAEDFSMGAHPVSTVLIQLTGNG